VPGERLSGKHGKRREHTHGIHVATRFNRVKDRERNPCRHLGLLQRYEQGDSELLQLGRVLQRRHPVKDCHELRDDLLAQDL
jgi:hypothetical protein